MKYLTVSEAAAKYELSPRRVQQMCKAGEIPGAVKDGRVWMVPKDAVPEDSPTAEMRDRLLPLPVGISSYTEAVSNYYYVDKTLLIRDFLDTLPKVSLFTRPRRFGKTLNMDMLRVYFEKSDSDTSAFFRNKAIWACGEHYRSFQGRYPVIYLSFKDVKYSTWSDAYKDISESIATEFARHAELAESPGCSAMEKNYYRRIVSGVPDEVDLSRSLSMLSGMLRKHYGEAAVIIIDEYDTPIQQGHLNGYYREVVAFIRNLFSGAFKDNPSLAYGFLTGILRVAKESIFSGMNNLKVHTIMDSRFGSYFGFTREEVAEMLNYYGRPEKMEEVCEWYDGYLFGSSEIFNPWSVINYVDEGCRAKAFWQSTGSNDIIGEIAAAATPDITENLRKLMQGESVTTVIDADVIYPRVKENPFSIYSFLLLTGYLKNAEIVPQADGNYMCKVKIPNKEITLVYSREVLDKEEKTENEAIGVIGRNLNRHTNICEDDFGINEMQEMQKALQDKYKDIWKPICPDRGKDQLLWMIGEIGEVIDIVKKHGGENASQDAELREHLVEELADVLMYYNDILLCYGISAEELKRSYISKYEKT